MVLKVNNLSLPLKWTPTGPLLFIEDKYLQPIEWIINSAVIGEIPQLTDHLARAEDAFTEGFFAVRPPSEDVLPKDWARWRELTGEELGEDVYMVGTTFTHEVVMPRKTLLQIIQALEKKRAEFPEPPFPWLFRLKPYFFSPALEGERELVCELEKRAQAFGRMQKEDAADETTRKKLLDDLQAAGVFSEVYSKQKQEWLERWGAEKLLIYHTDAMKFLNHFRSQVQPPAAQEMVPASVLGASISVGAWKSPWRR